MRLHSLPLAIALLLLSGTHFRAQGPKKDLGANLPLPGESRKNGLDAGNMSVAEIVTKVSKNVEEMYWGALADFYCKGTFVNKSIRLTKEFTVTGKAIQFRPGKEPALNWQPYLVTLLRAFGPEYVSRYTYTSQGTTVFQGQPALVLHFVSKENRNKTSGKTDGKVTGTAWIDTTAMRVIHLEELLQNPKPNDYVSTTLDYGNIEIKGAEYWLPTRILTRYQSTPTKISFETTTEFHECHRFETSVEIIPR